jgi:hypothetical protein
MDDATANHIREALGLTPPWREKHARHNLDGALIDIQHRDGYADDVCRQTIRRVIGQLSEVEKILECADAQ